MTSTNIDLDVYVQAPTPPQSPKLEGEERTLLSVSTSFSPNNLHHTHPPDLVILSSDSVYFYVHLGVLSAASNNAFNALLSEKPNTQKLRPTPIPSMSSTDSPSPPRNIPTSHLPIHSSTLNVILHTIYNISCAQYAPSISTLTEAVDLLPSLGISPSAYIHCTSPPLSPALPPSSSFPSVFPSPTPLFSLLVTQTPLNPLAIYALAAHHNLHTLAVVASQYTLRLPLYTIDDDLAHKMGASYLKKLVFLHFGRIDALKRIVARPPGGHAHAHAQGRGDAVRGGRGCGETDKMKLERAWALGVASLVWDAKPDTPATVIESTLLPLADHLSCSLCVCSLRDRVVEVVTEWDAVKRTI